MNEVCVEVASGRRKRLLHAGLRDSFLPWLLGGLAGLSAMTAKPHPFVAAAWFLLLGGLLAADAKVSLRVTTALAALLGIYHGYLNGIGKLAILAVDLLARGVAFFVAHSGQSFSSFAPYVPSTVFDSGIR
ncbi:MAG TPA: hypothetical protein VK638_40820 [Edaphobacter sp.]|nr:hypothetical protein [Edaphobacter sp.]